VNQIAKGNLAGMAVLGRVIIYISVQIPLSKPVLSGRGEGEVPESQIPKEEESCMGRSRVWGCGKSAD
jgi:hypothetical protein